jgi:hypothetical protein
MEDTKEFNFITETKNLKCTVVEPAFAFCHKDGNPFPWYTSTDNLSTLFGGNMTCMGRGEDVIICAKNNYGLRQGLSYALTNREKL